MPHTEDHVNIIGWIPAALKIQERARDGTGAIANWVMRPQQKTVYFKRVRVQPLGECVATVARLFLNNGKDHTVAANNQLWDEITMPLTAVSEVAQLAYQPFEVNLWLPAGYRVNITIGTTVVAGFSIIGTAGKYSESVGVNELYEIPG